MIKLTFFIATVKTFPITYNLAGFSDIHIFPLFLVMISLWRHFLSHGSQICISCSTYQKIISLQSFWCRFSDSSFTEELENRMMIFGIRKFPYFVKLVISCQPAKFQISQLSETNFTDVDIEHPKTPL